MTRVDRVLQRLRERAAVPYIPDGSRLLDVGCADGGLLRAAGSRVRDAMGIDPAAPSGDPHLMRGRFPDDVPASAPFDVITMLAVFEHFAEPDRPRVVEACRRLLRPGGRVILTVPSSSVDGLVGVLRRLRIVQGMDIASHHGYDPRQTPAHFTGFALRVHRSFEFGLNHLYVLERAG